MRAFNLMTERVGAASLSRTFHAAGHLQNVDDAAKSVQVKPASSHCGTEHLAAMLLLPIGIGIRFAVCVADTGRTFSSSLLFSIDCDQNPRVLRVVAHEDVIAFARVLAQVRLGLSH
jgi:hypothetical protein